MPESDPADSLIEPPRDPDLREEDREPQPPLAPGRTEATIVVAPPSAPPEPEPGPEAGRGKKSADTAEWTLKAAVFLLVLTAVPTIWANSHYPSIDAAFETSQPKGVSVVELTGATVEDPLEAEVGSFGFSQIAPPGATGVDVRGTEVLVRLRVSAGSCGELEARIGGSCGGRPKPPLHEPERFEIRAEPDSMEALVSTAPGAALTLGQDAEPARQGPAREWSLSADRGRTTVTLRCQTATPLGVTLLPGQAHADCAPDGRFHELLIVNDRPYLPILSFKRARTFVADAEARRATMTAARGTLTLGGSPRKIRGAEPTEVSVLAADGEQVHMHLAAPSAADAAPTSLDAPQADAVLANGSDQIPSLLDRHTTIRTSALGILGALLITVLINLVVVVGGRRPSR